MTLVGLPFLRFPGHHECPWNCLGPHLRYVTGDIHPIRFKPCPRLCTLHSSCSRSSHSPEQGPFLVPIDSNEIFLLYDKVTLLLDQRCVTLLGYGDILVQTDGLQVKVAGSHVTPSLYDIDESANGKYDVPNMQQIIRGRFLKTP